MLRSGLDAHPTINILRIKLTQIQEARDEFTN
jgi:hypothetical protein